MGKKRAALRAAFPHTIPIMAGFLFLGMTYGVYARVSGLDFWYPMLMSLLIYAGSAEFLAVNLLMGAFDPVQAFFAILMINARHLFYGVSMLEKYKGLGWKKPYLIYGLTDESFSVNCSVAVPSGVDRGWFYFFTTLLNHGYWIAGASLGSLFGSFVSFNTEGLDFVMTAMFAVIFLEQWLKEKNHTASLLGVGLSVGCLLLFGADRFLLPTMVAILLSLTVLWRVLDREVES